MKIATASILFFLFAAQAQAHYVERCTNHEPPRTNTCREDTTHGHGEFTTEGLIYGLLALAGVGMVVGLIVYGGVLKKDKSLAPTPTARPVITPLFIARETDGWAGIKVRF